MTHEEFINQYLNSIPWHIDNNILYVDQHLDLRWDSKYNVTFKLVNTTITLPDNLHICGFLDLQGTNIEKLPDNLHIERWLDIRSTSVAVLPENLTVGMWLAFYSTEITILPESLSTSSAIYSGKKLSISPEMQLNIVANSIENIKLIKKPTKKTISLHKLLWEI